MPALAALFQLGRVLVTDGDQLRRLTLGVSLSMGTNARSRKARIVGEGAGNFSATDQSRPIHH